MKIISLGHLFLIQSFYLNHWAPEHPEAKVIFVKQCHIKIIWRIICRSCSPKTKLMTFRWLSCLLLFIFIWKKKSYNNVRMEKFPQSSIFILIIFFLVCLRFCLQKKNYMRHKLDSHIMKFNLTYVLVICQQYPSYYLNAFSVIIQPPLCHQ